MWAVLIPTWESLKVRDEHWQPQLVRGDAALRSADVSKGLGEKRNYKRVEKVKCLTYVWCCPS